MNKTITVLALASCLSLGAVAQNSSSGALVRDSKSGLSVPGARISLHGPTTRLIVVDARGLYQLPQLPEGRYTLTVTAPGYEAKQLVYIHSLGKALPLLELVPLPSTPERYDELLIADDSDDAVSGSDRVSLLTSSKDPFLSASSYVFSTARFRARGYDSPYSSQMLNGVEMNDLNSGYSAWSLWGGLNDVTRLQQT